MGQRERETIVARVTIEERFAVVMKRAGLSWAEIAARAALSPAEGGLGWFMPSMMPRRRFWAYRGRVETAQRQVRLDEAERREWLLDDEIARTYDGLCALDAGSPAYRRLRRRLDALEREERRLHRLGDYEGVPVPLPPLTPAMRASVEHGIALDVVEAVALMPSEDRPHLLRTLLVDGPPRG